MRAKFSAVLFELFSEGASIRKLGCRLQDTSTLSKSQDRQKSMFCWSVQTPQKPIARWFINFLRIMEKHLNAFHLNAHLLFSAWTDQKVKLYQIPERNKNKRYFQQPVSFPKWNG